MKRAALLSLDQEVKCCLSPGKTKLRGGRSRMGSGGVAILFSRVFLPVSSVTEEIVESPVKLTLINVYAPTVGTERETLLNTLNSAVNSCSGEGHMFLGGDFNCTADAALDRNHAEPHGASRRCLVKLIEQNDLCDTWRFLHHTQRQYTWVHTRDYTLSMLDRFYCFKHQANALQSGSIHPVGFSDHSLVQVPVSSKI